MINDLEQVETVRRRLKTELDTGVRLAHNILPFAKQILEWNDIVPKHNKIDVLAQLDVLVAGVDVR